VSIEALVLALSAVIRPTTIAAVFTMLSTQRPQRLLVAYVLAGLTFSLFVGMLVVVVLSELDPPRTSSGGHPQLDILLGTAALGYAMGAWTGWLPRRRAEAPPGSASRLQRRLQDVSPAGAALVAVLTHLPGLVYLAALNAIAGTATGNQMAL
jgi:hypothetical protein